MRKYLTEPRFTCLDALGISVLALGFHHFVGGKIGLGISFAVASALIMILAIYLEREDAR